MTTNQLSILSNSLMTQKSYTMQKLDDNSVIEDFLLDEKGNIRCVSAETLRTFSFQELRQFAQEKAIYQFPTFELISLLSEIIGNDSCLEIAAGSGSIGRHLGIKMTDSYLQNRREVKELYKNLQAPTIIYPNDVEKLSAKDAIKKYKPKCVLGCWATHLYTGNNHHQSGSIYGIDYDWVYNHVNKFILVTNSNVHANFPLPRGVKFSKIYESNDIISRAKGGISQVWVFSHK